MDRVIKSLIIALFLLLSASSFLSCQENYNKQIRMTELEVNYDIDLMLDAQNDNPQIPESVSYSEEIIKAEREFLNSCSYLLESSFVGSWRLIDEKGNYIENQSLYFDGNINISIYNNKTVLDDLGNRSYIYTGDNGRMYIYSRWINIIRLLVFKNDKLYVYTVKDNQWILDPIHMNGRYWFQKEKD